MVDFEVLVGEMESEYWKNVLRGVRSIYANWSFWVLLLGVKLVVAMVVTFDCVLRDGQELIGHVDGGRVRYHLGEALMSTRTFPKGEYQEGWVICETQSCGILLL